MTDKDATLNGWAEHFDNILNRTSTINDNVINRLTQLECNPLFDEFPNVTKTTKAVGLIRKMPTLKPVYLGL